MPELSTPPRRRSTSAASSVSRAGSNSAAVREMMTPAPVVKVVLSTVGLLYIWSSPVSGGRNEKRPPLPGRSLRQHSGHRLPAAPPLKVKDRSHCAKPSTRVTASHPLHAAATPTRRRPPQPGGFRRFLLL